VSISGPPHRIPALRHELARGAHGSEGSAGMRNIAHFGDCEYKAQSGPLLVWPCDHELWLPNATEVEVWS
jgi:hypothetical protein